MYDSSAVDFLLDATETVATLPDATEEVAVQTLI
jgi:hypothetical protein